MKKKHLIMIMAAIFVCGLCMSGYMLTNGFAKADEVPTTEVQIDDGFVVVIDNDSNAIEEYSNVVSATPITEDQIAEASVEIEEAN